MPNCSNCDEEQESSWNFCPTCGVNQAPVKKLVRAYSGESEESKKRRQMPSMREMVLDVVARQAISGANWKILCRDVMEMHEISAAEVKKELYNRGYKIEADGSLVKISETGQLGGNLKNVEETNLVVFRSASKAAAKGAAGESMAHLGPTEQEQLANKLINRVQEIFKRNFESNADGSFFRDENSFDDLFERKLKEAKSEEERQRKIQEELEQKFRQALKATLSDLNKLLEELG